MIYVFSRKMSTFFIVRVFKYFMPKLRRDLCAMTKYWTKTVQKITNNKYKLLDLSNEES